VAAAAAALLSLVTRRTRGMYFVIVTFAALQLVGVAATTASGLTGGSQGLALPLPTWSLSYQDWPFYYPMLGLLVVTVAVAAWVRRSKLGLGLFAIRDDEDKAAGLGLRTAVYKMIAFVLGGTFVGIAGRHLRLLRDVPEHGGRVRHRHQRADRACGCCSAAVAPCGGPVLGAFIVAPISNLTSTSLGGADAGAIRLLLFGGLLGGVALFLPRGVLPVLSRLLPARPSLPVPAWRCLHAGREPSRRR